MADYDSSLPVRSEVNNSTSDLQISIADGTVNSQLWNIDTNGIGQVNLNDGTTALTIQTGGNLGNVIYDSTGANSWGINSGGAGPVVIQDTDVTPDIMAVNDDGSINVNVVTSTAGDQIHKYDTVVGAAASATPVVVLTYTVTTAKTLLLQYVHASASGKAKVIVKAGTPSSETIRAVFFVSTANGFGFAEFPNRIEVIAGDNVLVAMANIDKGSQDLYAYINGVEV